MEVRIPLEHIVHRYVMGAVLIALFGLGCVLNIGDVQKRVSMRSSFIKQFSLVMLDSQDCSLLCERYW